MSTYLFLYFFIISMLLKIGYSILLKYKNKTYGKYFFLSTIFSGVWLSLYLVSFSSTYNREVLLYLSRSLYGFGLIIMYYMLFFIVLFRKDNKKLYKIINLISLLFFIITFFSPYIIDDMLYDKAKGIYYESYGVLYIFYEILYLFFLPLFSIFSYITIKKQSIINKIRLRYISIGFFIFVFFELLFLILLPIFGIRVLEKEQVIFFIPFLFFTWYSIHKYHFSNLKLGIGRLFIFIISILASILVINLLKFYYLNLDYKLVIFWGISNSLGIIDLFLFVIIYTFTNNTLKNYFLGITDQIILQNKISRLKKQFTFFTDIELLNSFLNKEFNKLFKVDYVKINLFTIDENNEIKSYFTKNILNDLFINDIVFIEENKHKFNYKSIKSDIDKNSYLIFPLKNTKNQLIGTFSIGKKIFGDIFFTEEIVLIKDFLGFLEGHLKYIEIYNKINDLNINLDKKVDKKTMEYNSLINKQKEFISLISHEVKGPISSCIFQIDCIIDDVKDGHYDKKYLQKELNILNEQLIKSGELINKLFSIERYDLEKFTLFKEKVKLTDILSSDIDIFKKKYENIDFQLNIDKNIGFIEIDKVQIKQVIDNLVTNSIKFSDPKNPIVRLNSYLVDDFLLIEVEDNGKTFNNLDISMLFKKYSTGKNIGIGLGMGLYLCKKIVELHNGTIDCAISEFVMSKIYNKTTIFTIDLFEIS